MAEGKHLNIPVVKKTKQNKKGNHPGCKHNTPCCVVVGLGGGGAQKRGLAAASMTSFSTAAERCSDKIQNHLIQGDRVRLRHRHNSDKAPVSPRTFTIKAKLSVA